MVDWGTVAAIIVALVAIMGLIVQIFKRERPWKRKQEEFAIRITALEEKVTHLADHIKLLREDIDDHDKRDTKDFERIETKIEKLTDLMIDLAKNEQSLKPPTK